jgi:hypothetical protein
MDLFELWSYDINGLGDYAEHTYIRCPDKNTYFNCWGDHQSTTQGPGTRRFSCQGIYDVANCYRNDILNIKDTAGIGIYGINGVCHQTANLFLYSTGRAITIGDGVRGYALSSLAYGIYGDLNPFNNPAQPIFLSNWIKTVYDPCYQKIVPRGNAGETLFLDLQKLHKSLVKGFQIGRNELIHNESAILIKQIVPDIDTNQFKNIHLDFLEKKTEVIRKGFEGEKLAIQINQFAEQIQKSLADKIGGKTYEKLTGLKVGETLNIVDPAIAAKAAQQRQNL